MIKFTYTLLIINKRVLKYINQIQKNEIRDW